MSIFDESNINTIRFHDLFNVDEMYNFDCVPSILRIGNRRDLDLVTNNEFLYYFQKGDSNFFEHAISRRLFNELINECLVGDECWIRDDSNEMFDDLKKSLQLYLLNHRVEFLEDICIKMNSINENYNYISFGSETYTYPKSDPFEYGERRRSNKLKVLHILMKFDPCKVRYPIKLVSVILS